MQLVRAFTMTMIVALGGVALAAGEGGKQNDEVPLADAQAFQVFFDKFVDTVLQNRDACPKMASSISALVDQNQDLVKKANDYRKAKKKLPKSVEEKMQARVKEMMPAMQKCGSDKDVKEAIAKMDKRDDAAK